MNLSQLGLAIAASALLLSGAAVPALRTAPPPDPCLVATSTAGVIAYDVVKKCLDADFPFPINNRPKTADTIKKLFENSYVFNDMVETPPDVPGLTLIPVNVVKEVEALVGSGGGTKSATAALTHRQFHEGIADIMIKARDAHLAYVMGCFSQFSFDHGFMTADVVNTATGIRSLTVVYSAPSFSSLSSLKFEPLLCTVATINGQDAYQFLKTWADKNVDSSKDASIRYNVAISGPFFSADAAGQLVFGKFHHRQRLPAESSLRFGFSCPNLWGNDAIKQVDVKWGASYKGDALTVPQYYKAHCALPEVTKSSSGPQTVMDSDNQDDMTTSNGEDQYDQQAQIPFDELPVPKQQEAITKTVEEFKALPQWLVKRTEEVILGPDAVNGPNKIEWTDETDEQVLRDRVERILREKPLYDLVPKIPIFEPPRFTETHFTGEFKAADQDYQVLINSPLGVHAILLGDNKTGIIKIPTFDPEGGDTIFDQFYANLVEAIAVLRPVAEKLILDVTRNGGGSVCLARWTLDFFFPDTPLPPTNILHSNVEDFFVWADSSYKKKYARSTDLTFVDMDYLSTVISNPNRRANFTDFFTDVCTGFNNYKLPVDPNEESLRPRALKKGYVYDPKKAYHPWDPEDILIFDEGTCGSACATFANQMHQKNKVKAAVLIAGTSEDDATFSSFPGGQVLTSDRYFSAYKSLKGIVTSSDDPEMRKIRTVVEQLAEPFQHDAKMTLTWRQTYDTGNAEVLFAPDSTGQLIPDWPNYETAPSWTDYAFIPADFRIPITLQSYISYHYLWENARDAAWV
ncbi:hypothetical protein BGZ83_009329 [Gryganskiella cystojenkinii]|nr:hypothetical protein BGZ83_009329 [Gryganskiella cystojenkinii]